MNIRMTQLLALVLVTFGLASVSQADGLKYKLASGGTFVDTSFDTNSDGFNVNVVRGSGKGTFGQADSVIVTEFAPLGVTGECESEDDFRFMVLDSNGVSTYSKGEHLYLASNSGYLCLDFATGDFEGLVTGDFAGGTGRFEDANGTWDSRFSGRNLTVPIGLPYAFGSINSVTTGTLNLK